jgi:hypothetical protein
MTKNKENKISKVENKDNNIKGKTKKPVDVVTSVKKEKKIKPKAKKRGGNKGTKGTQGLDKKVHEYVRFVEWCATPTPLRKPALQKDLAKEMGVDEGTLSDWKKKDVFFSHVERAIRKSYGIDKTANVIHSLYSNIMKKGNGVDTKIWLEYVNGFNPKNITEDVTVRPPVDPLQVAEISRAMANAGLGALLQSNEELKKQFIADQKREEIDEEENPEQDPEYYDKLINGN